jgi:RNA polymerase sigma-70 factor, ECF subfamily
LRTISNLYESSRAGAYGFTLAEFCDLVAGVARRALGDGCSVRDQTRFLESLHLDDLVLARACARGHEAAWEQFLFLYREKLYTAAVGIARDDCAGRELADSLYADLFGTRLKKDGRRSSKFESYAGRGSLEGWLRTVLAQEYVNRFRQQRKLVPFDEAVDTGTETTHEAEPAKGLLEDATDAALSALSAEERVLLAAYYLDGRTLAEIGCMLSVHESTVGRRLEKITRHVRKRIISALCTAGLSKRVAEEMLQADVREIGVDVRGRLAQERQA